MTHHNLDSRRTNKQSQSPHDRESLHSAEGFIVTSDFGEPEVQVLFKNTEWVGFSLLNFSRFFCFDLLLSLLRQCLL